MIVSGLLIAIVVCFGLGLAGLGLATVRASLGSLRHTLGDWQAARASRRWASTTGKVTRSVVTRQQFRRSVSYGVAVRYHYQVAGKKYVSTNLSFTLPHGAAATTLDDARQVAARFPPKSSVTVYYDAKRPKRAILDRATPPLLAPALLWLLLVPVGCAIAAVGGAVAIGPFEDPPHFEPGELPTEPVQAGGVLTGVGGLWLSYAVLRAALQRKTRRRLRQLASATPCFAKDATPGQYVAIFGRAEEGPDGVIPSPFERRDVLVYGVAIHDGLNVWRRSQAVATLVTRDAQGTASLFPGAARSLLASTPQGTGPRAQRWLDRRYAEEGLFPPASYTLMLEQIRSGDPLLFVGQATPSAEFDTALVARPDDPDSLFYADAPLEEVLERLGAAPRRTRVHATIGGVLITVGSLLLLLA